MEHNPRHPRVYHRKPRASRYLVALTENTHWIVDYQEKQYIRIPRRERTAPHSVAGRLVDNVWHKYSTLKIVIDPDTHERHLRLKTPDLPISIQRGIESGMILRLGRVNENPESAFE
jgi:hypothetical protein